jgi:hypothetical protein
VGTENVARPVSLFDIVGGSAKTLRIEHIRPYCESLSALPLHFLDELLSRNLVKIQYRDIHARGRQLLHQTPSEAGSLTSATGDDGRAAQKVAHSDHANLFTTTLGSAIIDSFPFTSFG